jgi:hypothetical protein
MREQRPLPGLWSVPAAPRPEQCLEQVRTSLALARQSLTTANAESLERCAACLVAVGDLLRPLTRTLAKSGEAERRALADSARAAQSELERVNQLFQSAAILYFGWIKLLSARKCGYTRTGAPARLTCSRQFVIKI